MNPPVSRCTRDSIKRSILDVMDPRKYLFLSYNLSRTPGWRKLLSCVGEVDRQLWRHFGTWCGWSSIRTGMENESGVNRWLQKPWFRGVAVLAAVGLAIGVWWVSRPSLPDQQEAEQEVASGVGEA